MIELGARVKDKITGLTGIAVGRTIWIHGCVRITVQPEEFKDGKPVDMTTFDEPQLEVVVPPEPAAKPTGATGGPRPDAGRRSDVSR